MARFDVNDMVWFGEVQYNKSDHDALQEANDLGYLNSSISESKDGYKVEIPETTADLLRDEFDIKGQKVKDLREDIINLFSDHISSGDLDVVKSSRDYPVTLYKRLLFYDDVIKELKSYATTHSFAEFDEIGEYSHGSDDKTTIPKKQTGVFKLKTSENPYGKTSVIIISGLHGDEFLSVHTNMEFIKYMVELYKQNQKNHAHFVHDLELIVVPVANPDGYRCGCTINFGQRKNFFRDKKDHLVGVDLNRNFPVYYGWDSQTHEKAGYYHGMEPISEPESINLDSLLRRYSDSKLLIDLHCGETKGIFHPKTQPRLGFPKDNATRLVDPSSLKKYHKLRKAFEQEIQFPGAGRVIFGERGPAAGTLDEYAFHVYGIPSAMIEVFEDKKKKLTRTRLKTIKASCKALSALVQTSISRTF